MRILTLTIATLCLASLSYGQEADSTSIWKNQMVGSLNLTQASFSNWEQGGENSLAWQVKLDSKFERDAERWNWSSTTKFELGFAKVADVEARKSSDLLDIETVLTRKMNKLLNPFVSATAKTQFVSGFQYGEDTKTKVSKFLDPGYFTQSAGVGYKPNDMLQSRVGFTIKETVTSEFPSPYADDPATLDKLEKTKVEPGISSVTDFKKQFDENVLYVSKLDIFSDFEGFNRIDLLWENRLTLKVSKYINVNVSVDVLYDRDVTSKAQVKEILGVGLSYSLL